MLTKEACLEKYAQCKRGRSAEIPEYREFLIYAGIDKRQLAALFGASAYSKLQIAAGDTPNRLQLDRTPLSTIMRQYGSLVTELGAVPAYAEWAQRGFKPSESGLRAKPHNMKWSELPAKFVEWAATNSSSGFEDAIEILARSARVSVKKARGDGGFLRLVGDVRGWTPARRRNSEAEYKIELRKHLESLKYLLNEEFGESKYDLLVDRRFAIELKKDPDLAEYDRLFGQIARHLQHQSKVVVLILEATRKDKYDNFTSLVDKYLDVHHASVEIIAR